MDLITESISIMMYGDAIGYGTFTSLLQYYGQINDESVMGDAEIVYPTTYTVTGSGYYAINALGFGQSGADQNEIIVIDWGDGTINQYDYNSSRPYSHSYSSNGTYTITVLTNGTRLKISSDQVIDPVKATSVVLGTDVWWFGELNSDRTTLTSIEFKNPYATINEDSPDQSFMGHTALVNVILPARLSTIGHDTFNGATALPEITIPETVTSIATKAFKDCTSLAEVTVLATTPPTLAADAFEGCTALTAIYVPSDSVAAYQSAWSDYSSIIQAIS